MKLRIWAALMVVIGIYPALVIGAMVTSGSNPARHGATRV